MPVDRNKQHQLEECVQTKESERKPWARGVPCALLCRRAYLEQHELYSPASRGEEALLLSAVEANGAVKDVVDDLVPHKVLVVLKCVLKLLLQRMVPRRK